MSSNKPFMFATPVLHTAMLLLTKGIFHMSESMISTQSSQLVPAPFAEKAMASLMQLHGELMDEKERRVDLFRRLMEREQSMAELKFYVKVLEERLEKSALAQATVATVLPPRPSEVVAATPNAPVMKKESESKVATPRSTFISTMPMTPPIPKAAPVHGWRTW